MVCLSEPVCKINTMWVDSFIARIWIWDRALRSGIWDLDDDLDLRWSLVRYERWVRYFSIINTSGVFRFLRRPMSAVAFTQTRKKLAKAWCDIDQKVIDFGKKLSAIFGKLSAMRAIFSILSNRPYKFRARCRSWARFGSKSCISVIRESQHKSRVTDQLSAGSVIIIKERW